MTTAIAPHDAGPEINRRLDPRTDRLYSLRNLLRVKAEKYKWPLVVLGNNDDVMIAASHEDFEARGALIKASRSGRLPVFNEQRDEHSSLRFKVGDQTLVLVALGQPTGSFGPNPGMLEDVLLRATAERIRTIFQERPRYRGDEDAILHESGRFSRI